MQDALQFASPVGTKSVPTGGIGHSALSMNTAEPTDDHQNATSVHTPEPNAVRGRVTHDMGKTGASKVGAIVSSSVEQEKTTG